MKVFTRVLATVVLFAGAGAAQIIEDFKCSVPALVTNSSPAIVTCPTPHGWNQRAVTNLTVNTSGRNGDAITLDGTTYTFVTSLNNSVANQVLIGQSNRDTTWNLFHAVNDDGYLKGTVYSSATTAHPTFTAGTSFQSYGVTFLYKTPGPQGIGKAVATNDGATFSFDTNSTRMEWFIFISGGTGGWSNIGSNQSPRFFYARYLDGVHYSLWLNAVTPYDSSGNGPFTGQSLLITPAEPDGQAYPMNIISESWSTTGTVTPDGFFQVNVPGCPNPNHDLECSQSRRIPDNNRYVGPFANLASFTISGGVGTMTFTAPFPYQAGGLGNISPGNTVWPRNIPDPPGTWTHTITATNDPSGTTTNHLVKYVPNTELVRGVQNLETGGVIGVCLTGCGTSGPATIATAGLMACAFDNAHVAGHWVQPTGYDDRCHDVGTTNYLGAGARQPLGVVQASGPAGATDNIWWNGLNGAFTVQSMNGPPDGSNTTRITVNVPGYPDGNYSGTARLAGAENILPGSMLQANVSTNSHVTPYVIFVASYVGGYRYPLLPRIMKDQSGFDPATTNRISFWVKWNKSQQACGINSGALSVGTYVLWPGVPAGSQGAHYYNEGDPEFYAGQWARYDINLAPSHQVGIGSAYNYPADITYQGGAGGWHGNAHYLDRMGTFYMDLSGVFCPAARDASGQTIYISPITLSSAAAEPEEMVRARFGTWSPSLFRPGDVNPNPTGPPGYSLSWSALIWGVGPVQYEVRYSTQGSLKTLGFSNGLCQNGTTSCGPADRVASDGNTQSVAYKSAPLDQQQNIWWAIKPISIPIASVTSGQNPTWIITQMDTGFAAGDRVTVSGLAGGNIFGGGGGTTNIATSAVQPRQMWTRFDPVPFALGGLTFPQNSGGPVKITGYANHGLFTGQTIQLYGASPAGLNGQHTITVVDANSFTLDGTTFDGTCPCSGGVERLNLPSTLVSITSDGRPSPNTTCTVNLTVPHNLAPGWIVDVMGAPEGHLSYADSVTPISYKVTAVRSPTSFDFTCAPGTPTNATFNTDNPGGNFAVQSWPGVAIPVAGGGNFSKGAYIFSNEDNRNFAEIQLSRFDGTAEPHSPGKPNPNPPPNPWPVIPPPGAEQPEAVNSCAVRLPAQEMNAGARGTSASTIFSAAPQCSWRASSQASWITLNAPFSGKGNGAVFFSIAPNSGLPRTSELTIGNQRFVIRQAGRPPEPSKTGVFQNGAWILDRYSDGGDYRIASLLRLPAHITRQSGVPVVGDWNGDGYSKLGLFESGRWTLDYNGGNQFDRILSYTAAAGDTPVVGDWNGDGRAKAGVFRSGLWLLDWNADGGFSRSVPYGSAPGDIPVVGDWNGNGLTKLGIFRGGHWILDYNGDGSFGHTVTFAGAPDDTPVVGDWNGDGRAKLGIFRSGQWVLDYDGDASFNRIVTYSGAPGDVPVVGDWNGDGRTKVGVYRPGVWILDVNGDGSMDVGGNRSGRVLRFNPQPGAIPIVGRWATGAP